MSGLFELTNMLGVLQVGRDPEWTEQLDISGDPEYAGAPSRANCGVYLQNTVQALVKVVMRREAHRRTCYVTPGTFDATTTYTTTIGGHAVPATGATLAALLTAIVAAIVADADANPLVTATVIDADDDGTNDSVRLVGKAEADYSLAVSKTGGTGTITATADPLTATARLWDTGKGPNAPGRTGTSSGDPGAWTGCADAEYALTRRGMTERFPVPGLERLYVELDDVAGHASDSGVTYTPRVFIGPCVAETE